MISPITSIERGMVSIIDEEYRGLENIKKANEVALKESVIDRIKKLGLDDDTEKELLENERWRVKYGVQR